MQIKLRIAEGSNAGKEILVAGNKFLIGRADDCHLKPNSDAISRHHCVIIVTENAVGVRDLKSRNGTVVNGVKITADKRLKHGDTLAVGPLKMEVVMDASAPNVPAPNDAATATKVSGGEKEKSAAVGKDSAKVAGKEASSKPASTPAMDGMVSQWLEEADDFAREENRFSPPETREYRFDDTSKIVTDSDDDGSTRQERKRRKEKAQKELEAKDPSKLPKFEVKVEKPKDTHEAAQQALRKLFNRG